MWVYLFLLGLAFGAPFQDLVINQPQLPDVPNFDTYSGYLDIPNSGGKSLHYILVTSQSNPATDPLILWLNGGPGCSSLDGFFYEHGPYLFPEDGTELVRNQYAWNTNASVLYIEAPAGVGFSILGNEANNSTDDELTAHDNLLAVLQFFRKFPEYRNHDFYITGESYAGIYVPTLVNNILMYNSYTPYNRINIVGFAVGNGVTDWNYDTTPAFMRMAWYYGLIGFNMYNKLVQDCNNLNDWNSENCQNDTEYIYDSVLPNINIYDIYGQCIYHENALEDTKLRFKYLYDMNPNLGIIPPCVGWVGAYTYLRNDTVRAAFNIPTSVQEWKLCSSLNYLSDYIHGSYYLYPSLIRAGLKILIYSGDVDGAVPLIGTRMWLQNLNLQMITPYSSWYVDEQVAGFQIEYQGLKLVTVKGAGHMVPQWKPAQAWHMLYDFINGSQII
ncbi:unnamed protein product [Blepharisma stoltei]|uniref:Carboxypeptidase n=1 Tax=Blepharisma stoltei TaxID=1481888 RepID=A0AAU9KE40_9CILI|nr:unnamed protein product [Blepharisma stoltei]